MKGMANMKTQILLGFLTFVITGGLPTGNACQVGGGPGGGS